jgi:hypothetical protein
MVAFTHPTDATRENLPVFASALESFFHHTGFVAAGFMECFCFVYPFAKAEKAFCSSRYNANDFSPQRQWRLPVYRWDGDRVLWSSAQGLQVAGFESSLAPYLRTLTPFS